MTAPAPPPTSTEQRLNSIVLVSLSPCVLGLLCSMLSQANPGGAWWLFAGFGNAVGLLGIAAAVLIALISAALRRISLAFLLFVLVEIAFAALLSWLAANLAKNPLV